MEHYLKPYGISEAAVRAALKDPDSTKDLNFPNFPVRLILKKSNGYYLLIDGRRKEQFIVLRAVFRIFPHTIEGLDTHDPLIILQHFAQQFGRTIFVGEQFNKFITILNLSCRKRSKRIGLLNLKALSQDKEKKCSWTF